MHLSLCLLCKDTGHVKDKVVHLFLGHSCYNSFLCIQITNNVKQHLCVSQIAGIGGRGLGDLGSRVGMDEKELTLPGEAVSVKLPVRKDELDRDRKVIQ